jgi:SIR2-like domain
VSSLSLEEGDWDTLLQRIDEKKCTPFIGAGASAGRVPSALKLARKWAREYGFPLKDATNLGQVAQFLAIKRDGVFPKEQLGRLIRNAKAPNFKDPCEPHRVLADLELPIYVTTNYDSFMYLALQGRKVNPDWKVCGWNELIQEDESANLDGDPSPANPLVYHLHGHHEIPQSMVLTEDDYLEFLVRLTKEAEATERLLPYVIRTALAQNSLLFVGYSLSDWDFRVLFRGLIGSLGATLGSMSIAVQLDPKTRNPTEQWLLEAQDYLEKYFGRIQKLPVRIYWGDAKKFACDLSNRWKAFGGNGR